MWIMAKKGLAEWIIVLVMMIIIFMVGYFMLVQFTEARPAENALSDVRDAIESVCAKETTSSSQFTIFLPAGNKILLKPDGFMELHKDSLLSKKTLSCPSAIAFAECTIGPTEEGSEGVSFYVNKTTDATTKKVTITLTDATDKGLVDCEVLQ